MGERGLCLKSPNGNEKGLVFWRPFLFGNDYAIMDVI